MHSRGRHCCWTHSRRHRELSAALSRIDTLHAGMLGLNILELSLKTMANPDDLTHEDPVEEVRRNRSIIVNEVHV